MTVDTDASHTTPRRLTLASGDVTELATNHATLVTQSDLLADIFLASDELLIIGDANEPADIGPLP